MAATFREWENLRNHLQSIPEEGANGFEGLVARLLQLTTGETFRLANKGLQPAGDASIDSGHIAVQAKRYQENTPLNHSEIIGDVDRVLATHPGLDMYVLAMTRSIPNQLRAALTAKEAESGLDIITLAFGDDLPEIGILCVAHWPDLINREFFRTGSTPLREWLSRVHDEGRFRKDYEAVARNITDRWRTWQTLIALSQKHLNARFGVSALSHARQPFKIILPDAIRRASLVDAVGKWWQEPNNPIAVIEGEAGTGKSWGASMAVSELQKASDILGLASYVAYPFSHPSVFPLCL